MNSQKKSARGRRPNAFQFIKAHQIILNGVEHRHLQATLTHEIFKYTTYKGGEGRGYI